MVRLEVVGTRGEIAEQWFRMPGRAVLGAGAAAWVFEGHADEPFAPASPFPLDHLIACIENDRPSSATIRDARAAFAAAMGAYESARTGRPVRFDI